MTLKKLKRFLECFHSRGQRLCKFIGTKETVCIRKEFNSYRIGLGHQHGRRFIVLRYHAIWPPWRHVKILFKNKILTNFITKETGNTTYMRYTVLLT